MTTDAGRGKSVDRFQSKEGQLSAEPWAEAYKAVRAHELMLNQATSAFEHAVLAPLVVINGGAIVAFLTLLGALLADAGWPTANLAVAGAALMAWGGGLAVAMLATRAAFESQRNVSEAYRLLRQQLDNELFPSDIAGILRASEKDAREGSGEQSRSGADDAECGSDKSRRGRLSAAFTREATKFRTLWSASIALFLVGSVIALVALLIPREDHPAVTRPIPIELRFSDDAARKASGCSMQGPTEAVAVSGTLVEPEVVTDDAGCPLLTANPEEGVVALPLVSESPGP